LVCFDLSARKINGLFGAPNFKAQFLDMNRREPLTVD
jgi:hypothetical protein